MSHEDVNEASGGPRVQGGTDGGPDRQSTQGGGTQAHNIARTASQGVEHDRRRASEGDGSSVITASMSQMEMTSGPLPSSKELAGYEQVLPGAADRIIRMAEDSLHSEIDYQKQLVNIYAEDRKAENWVFKFTSVVFSLIPAASFVSALVFFALGRNVEAFTGVVGTIGFLVPQVIYAFKGRTPYRDKTGSEKDEQGKTDDTN